MVHYEKLQYILEEPVSREVFNVSTETLATLYRAYGKRTISLTNNMPENKAAFY